MSPRASVDRPNAAEGPSRTIIPYQFVLAPVVLLTAGLSVMFGLVENATALVLALFVTLISCTAALLVPWHALGKGALACIPTLDVLALAFLREASPESGVGLLWVFPVIWVAWTFGTVGTVIGATVVTVTYWVSNVTANVAWSPTTTVLFPLTIVSLCAVTHILARRTRAQRALLERQHQALARAVDGARRQEALLTGVLDAVDFGVVGYGPDGSDMVTNTEAARLGAIAEQAGTETYSADGVTALDRQHLPDQRAHRGEEFDGVLVWYGAVGHDRHAVLSTARALQDARGQDVGRIIVSRDVTAEQLALRAREDLVTSVSHELRTPLTAIIGHLDLAAAAAGLEPQTRRSLEVAERNAERLLDIIADIVSAAVQSHEGLQLDPQSADLDAAVRAAVESAEPRAASRGMVIDTVGIEPARAMVDIHRIRQVVDNLISNAIKYGRDDGRIDVGCTQSSESVWIAVRDDGPGISPAELPRLFDRFFRSDLVRKTSIHGSGLGLGISRDIVRAHGGEITVDSTLGHGATFVVRLPVGLEQAP